ncbi:hypothetical protein [Corynebacterium aquilae]|uniref:Uncharacterized protein n=1 Tax=Corynebacterium aquilae DSM 44791 TaxID=1431546 RepID=A0A1L7CHI1_9CORY|nr:hypothetical protein [Corynebacterium aquilae]APT85316.1 hypothetical protein CAQU_09835 [Corynebacterium aquilae DSM 44791]
MKKIVYVSPKGVRVDLTPDEGNEVFLKREGVEGLVGSSEFSTFTVPGVPGVLVGDETVSPISGSLTLYYPTEDKARAFLALWSTSKPGELEVTTRGGEVLSLPVRLSEYPELPADNSDTDGELTISVAADGGLWLGPVQTGTGKVTITNTGDAPVFPSILWKEASPVAMNTVLKTELPKVSSKRRVFLDPLESLVVKTARGGTDYATWDKVRALPLIFGVPKGGAGTIEVGGDAVVEYRLAYLNPRR